MLNPPISLRQESWKKIVKMIMKEPSMPKFNTITVLDYCTNQVRVYRDIHTDDPEKWLEENDSNWDDDQCYYMYGEDTEVIDEEGN